MSGLLEACVELFGTKDLYEIIQVTKKATESEIKKGYYKLSLKVHPDRVVESERKKATERFQVLGRVYSVLSDKDRRAIYDETGLVDDEDELDKDKDWYNYWRIIFRKISEEDIKAFEKDYRESETELADLKQAYLDNEGDMDRILENVLCSTQDDEERFREILQNLIEEGELEAFDAFIKEPKAKKQARKRKAAKEKKEAEKLLEELNVNVNVESEDDLAAVIRKRNEGRMDSLLASLEAKYSQPKKPRKSSKKGKGK